jgi:hypothetical protein
VGIDDSYVAWVQPAVPGDPSAYSIMVRRLTTGEQFELAQLAYSPVLFVAGGRLLAGNPLLGPFFSGYYELSTRELVPFPPVRIYHSGSWDDQFAFDGRYLAYYAGGAHRLDVETGETISFGDLTGFRFRVNRV